MISRAVDYVADPELEDVRLSVTVCLQLLALIDKKKKKETD